MTAVVAGEPVARPVLKKPEWHVELLMD